MRSIIILFCGLAPFLALPASATIINVPDDYDTIQEGINASTDGDTVLVQPGTYVENVNFNGHNVILGSLFLTTGDTSYTSATIIDGESLDTVVKFWNFESSQAALIGFTIRNGSGENYGGGISCRQANPLIANNIITQNSSGDQGGGIFCWTNSNPIIRSNIISNNIALDGGGIWSAYSFPLVEQNSISDNQAVTGGGISMRHCFESLLVFRGNIVVGNFADSAGSGIFLSHSRPAIANNTVVGNISNPMGGGLYLFSSSPTVFNSIFWNNGETEIFVDSWSSPEITYCDIQDSSWQSESNIYLDPQFRNPINNDFHLMYTACGDSIDSPCMDAGHPDIADNTLDCGHGLGTRRSDMGAYGGYNLRPVITSPSADTAYVGTFYCYAVEWSDPDGPDMVIVFEDYPNWMTPSDFEICGTPTELGDTSFTVIASDGFLPDTLEVLLTIREQTGITDYVDGIPGDFFINQCYPNPFNSQTTINFALPEPSHVSIMIYDLLGRSVNTLVDTDMHSGYHHVIWDAKDKSSGMYFFRIQAGEFVETKKMTLLK